MAKYPDPVVIFLKTELPIRRRIPAEKKYERDVNANLNEPPGL